MNYQALNPLPQGNVKREPKSVPANECYDCGVPITPGHVMCDDCFRKWQQRERGKTA